ncbi:MAG: molecular chaperone HtpG [Bacilli bacterium]|nr:molecular chaperone HtpG [Bacilli bacterium]
MKKEFKSESKRLLDLMVNAIYTNKDIFLRELISNASDALDKLYYNSLTDKKLKVNKEDLEINLDVDKEKRIIKISDNGIGMTDVELENNLGTIAKSGTLAFKQMNEKEVKEKNIDVIGQFGVGFYSAFMVSNKIVVTSKSVESDEAHVWESDLDGYSIKKGKKESNGTEITLYIKEDTEEENYSKYLDEYEIKNLIKKYSDYIRYPIKMEVTKSKLKENSKDEYEEYKEIETLNSMIPIWKKEKKDLKEDELDNFYIDKFYDYEKPLKVIRSKVEGMCSYNSLLFIPSHAPFDFYTKDYEKGLSLYASGVLIMDKCPELLPDYFSFVKGIVDTEDLSLNISREMLQKTHSLKIIAKNIESKIKKELLDMMDKNVEDYKKFFKAFGTQLKFGVYSNYGMDKDKLKDLLMFTSSKKKDLISLKEYVSNMVEKQENIYYASGSTFETIDNLPQTEQVKSKDYEILYLTDPVDEFCINALGEFEGKKFINVSSESLDLDTDSEKESLTKLNEDNKEMLNYMKDVINIKEVKFTNKLKNHPVCLKSIGDVSIEMQKVINAMPTDQKINAEVSLEINKDHPIAHKLKSLFKDNLDELKNYTKALYNLARLIEGLNVENPTEISNLIADIMSK